MKFSLGNNLQRRIILLKSKNFMTQKILQNSSNISKACFLCKCCISLFQHIVGNQQNFQIAMKKF